MDRGLKLEGVVRREGLDASYTQHAEQAKAALRAMQRGECPGKEYLGWLDLPGAAMEHLGLVEHIASRLRDCEAVVVIGIGGSYLGAKALLHALEDQRGDGVRMPLHFMGYTLCGDWLSSVLRRLDGVRYGVVMISKSGKTLEPAVSFRAILAHMRASEYGFDPERVVAITDGHTGALRALAERMQVHRLEIPSDVGGRYLVLTPAGLLPLCLGGVDVKGLIAGAQAAWEEVKEGGTACQVALEYASMRHALLREGKSVEVLATYTPYMQYFGEWYKQLFGESEGKCGEGLLPMSVMYSTDLHSLGQYVQEGQRILFETHLTFASSQSDMRVARLDPCDGELNRLEGVSFDHLNGMVCKGALQAHTDGGVPCIRLEVPCRSAYWMGYLAYLFEVACAVSVLMQGHNPFDQPGVEGYKRNMFRMLELQR